MGFRQGPMVALVLLSFALRIYNLAGSEFWLDEAISANIADLGWRGAIGYLRSEPFEHPPLYYLSLNPWLRLAGASEFALRFFSVFWGVLYVPLLYALIKQLADKRLALLVALLATFSPFFVTYSQETRMYTLLPCLALLLLLSFHRLLEHETQPGWWLIHALWVLVGMATHYYFALIWAAMTVYLLVEGARHNRMWLWGMAIQSSFLLAGMIWLVASPGPRNSLVRIFQGEMAFGLAYKLNKVVPTLVVSDSNGGEASFLALILAIGIWLLAVWGAWWSLRTRAIPIRHWRLLALLLIVPLAGSLMIPYGVLGRHLGYTLVAIFTFVALGLLALRRRGRVGLAAGALVVLLATTYGLLAQYTTAKSDFGQAMAHIDDRAQPDDLLILTQPAQQHLVDYYNRKGWPVHYLPSKGVEITPFLVEEELSALCQEHDRLWLGPLGAWTADPDSLVEQWLAANAFQAEKTWFDQSSSAALYFAAPDELQPLDLGRLVWGRRLLLQSAYAGPLRLEPGDAIRLRFQWQAGFDLNRRYAIRLTLVDGQGRVWAQRLSEPCGGWCLTDSWRAGGLFQDQHALLAPPGTPPGAYELQIAWLPVDSPDSLSAEVDGQNVASVTLAQVTVQPAVRGGPEPGSLPNPLRATFGGGVSLVGYDLAATKVQPGTALDLETHWRADRALADDLALLVELVDSQGRPKHAWQLAPFAGSYPTSLWLPGAYVRGQHTLSLPTDLPAGPYRLRLALLGPRGERLPLSGERPRPMLGGLFPASQRLAGDSLDLLAVDLRERPRRFDLLAGAQEMDATVGRQAHLVGYDLVGAEARPGDKVALTLVWQAGGPMAEAYKVFVHLLDGEGTIRAQHDGPPGGGCCPTATWVEGEVIVDEHPLALDPDLPAGAYQIVVGMYDEATNFRLLAYAGNGERLALDQVPVGQVVVQAASATAQPEASLGEARFGFDHHAFLPLVCRGGY